MERKKVLLVVHPDGYVELYGDEGLWCELVEYPSVPCGLEAEYDTLVRQSVKESHRELWQDPRLLTNAMPNRHSTDSREDHASAAVLAECMVEKLEAETKRRR